MSTPCLNAVERRVHRAHPWGPDVDTEDGNLWCDGFDQSASNHWSAYATSSYNEWLGRGGAYITGAPRGGIRWYPLPEEVRADALADWADEPDGMRSIQFNREYSREPDVGECIQIECPPIQEFRLNRPANYSIQFEMEILDQDVWNALTGEEEDES